MPKRVFRPKYLAFGFIGLMMAYVAVHNEYFLVQPNAPIWQHYQPIKWWLLPHGLAAACALLLGPMQFSDRLRQKYVKWHRAIGYVYVAGAVVGAPLGAIVQTVEGPKTWVAATVVDATLWTSTTLIALWFIRSGNITLHRQWMTRSYAIAIAFLEIRFISGLGGWDDNPDASLAIIWGCVAMSVFIGDVAIHAQDFFRKRAIARAT